MTIWELQLKLQRQFFERVPEGSLNRPYRFEHEPLQK